jgi:hypothetical protein
LLAGSTISELKMKTLKLLFLLGSCLLVSIAFPASAQTYDISWFSIDGGGGTSSGGTYSVTGTIGQPDAGVLSGGNYSIVGGFWSAIAEVSGNPESPQLSVAVLGQEVIISWPSPSTGFTLQETTSLNPPNWGTVPQPVNDNGTTKSIILTAPTGNMFYRLKY